MYYDSSGLLSKHNFNQNHRLKMAESNTNSRFTIYVDTLEADGKS